MRKILSLALVAGLTLAAASATAGNRSQYVYLFNDAPNAVTELRAIAADGTVTELVRDTPLRAQRDATVQFNNNTPGKDGCLYTIEATFSNGEPLTIVDYNACKLRSLHLGSALRAGKRAERNN